MKNVALLIIVFLVNGCCGIIEPSLNVYLGGYNVHSKKVMSEDFRSIVKGVGVDIANKLGYECSSQDRVPGLIIGIEPRNKSLNTELTRCGIEWYDSDSNRFGSNQFYIHVFNQNGSEETDEIRRVRKCIEDVLNEHPSFHFEYKVQHRAKCW
jgi:hypothetical protein